MIFGIFLQVFDNVLYVIRYFKFKFTLDDIFFDNLTNIYFFFIVLVNKYITYYNQI